MINSSFKTQLRGAWAAMLLMLASSSSFAVCCVFDSWSIVQAISTSTTTLSAQITASAQWSASQITAAIIGQQAVTSTSIREAAAMQSSATVRAAAVQERARADERYRMTDPCSVAAASVAGAAATSTDVQTAADVVGRRAGGGGTAGTARAGASGAMKQALDVSQGLAKAPAKEIAQQAAARGACESFGANDARGRACAAAGFRPSNSVGYANADINADTLMDGPQGSTPRKLYTVNLSPGSQEATAVAAYMRNLTPPPALRDLEDGELATDKGRAYMDQRNAYDARMSQAERPARRHLRQMAASVLTIPFVETLVNSAEGAYVRTLLRSDWTTVGVSNDEIMRIEVSRRYLNEAWLKKTADFTPEEAAREQLRLTALTNLLLFNLIQEQRETGVAVGAAAIAQTRAEMMPALEALHAKALR